MKTKYITFILFCLACSQFSLAQNNNKLFEKYADTDGVTSVYISKAMFKMMPAVENIGMDLANIKGKIESLNILTTKRKDLVPQMKKEFSQLIRQNHEELMRVHDGKYRVYFYAEMNGDKTSNLLMTSESDSEFTVIELLGHFTLQEIQEITKNTK